MSTLAVRAPESRRVPNAVLGMLLFLLTEVMLFGGLISGYIVLRSQAGAWPPADQPRLPVLLTAFNTVILLLSGYTMWAATRARASESGHRPDRMLSITLLLGGAFLALQGFEWFSLVSYGLTSSSSLYGSLFYTLVGVHGLHVVVALVALTVVWRRSLRGRYAHGEDSGLRAMGLYWLFVVAIWPPLYLVVYVW